MTRAILCSLLLLTACRDWDAAYEQAIDAGTVTPTTDAGADDAGTVDAGGVDAGQPDAGEPDAGPVDAGPAFDAGYCGDGGWCLVDKFQDTSMSTGGMWASAPNDVWVTSYENKVIHYDGQMWGPVFNESSGDIVYSVWARTADDVIVGADNSDAWRGPPFDVDHRLTGVDYNLISIHGTPDGGTIYATGEHGAVYRLEGTNWAAVDAGITSSITLMGLFVLAENDVWATGTDGIVLHFDGTTWDRKFEPDSTRLQRIWANGPDDVWFAGNLGRVLRWNGTAFSTLTCTRCSNIYGLWGRGPNDMYVYDKLGRLEHFDGTTWSTVAGIPPSVDINEYPAMMGAGDFDLFFISYGPDLMTVQHYRR